MVNKECFDVGSYRGVTSPSFSLRQVFCDNIWPVLPAIGSWCGRGDVPPPAEGGSFSKFIKCIHEI